MLLNMLHIKSLEKFICFISIASKTIERDPIGNIMANILNVHLILGILKNIANIGENKKRKIYTTNDINILT